MIERALHGVQQLLALKRLEEVVVGSATHGVNGYADIVNGGDHDDRQIGLKGVDALEESDAVDVVHHDVSEHKIKGVQLQSVESVAAVGGLLDCVSLALKSGGDHGADGGLVVDDENARGFARTNVAFVSRAHCSAHCLHVCQT